MSRRPSNYQLSLSVLARHTTVGLAKNSCTPNAARSLSPSQCRIVIFPSRSKYAMLEARCVE